MNMPPRQVTRQQQLHAFSQRSNLFYNSSSSSFAGSRLLTLALGVT